MRNVILIIIGNFFFLIVYIHSISKTYTIIRNRKEGALIIGLRLFFIFSVAIYFIVIALLTTYNYSFMRGFDLVKEGKYIEALIPLQRTIKIRDTIGSLNQFFDNKAFPFFMASEIRARYKLANAYRCLKDYPNAIEEYQNILSVEENSFEAISELAESFYHMNDIGTSLQYYDKLLDVEPIEKGFSYYYKTGIANMVLRNYQQAIECFNQALEFGEKEERITEFKNHCYERMNEKYEIF